MSFTDVFKKIFGTKADRDMKALKPTLDKVLEAYKVIDVLSDDELRARCQGLKDRIREAIAADEARVAEIKVELEKDIPAVYEILKKGSEVARAEAAQTLSEVKSAMRINYFDDAELIKAQSEKYEAQ